MQAENDPAISMRLAHTRPQSVLAITLLATLACVSCQKGGGAGTDAKAEYLRTASHEVDSTTSEWFGPRDLIARPITIMASEAHLFVTDFRPPYVHVLDLATGEHIKSFGFEGEGPGEFVAPHWQSTVVLAGTRSGSTTRRGSDSRG